jgi:hypothetical protein
MSGKDRLFREQDHEQSSLRRAPEFDLGLICMLALAALALFVALLFPEVGSTPADSLLSGP